MQISSVNSALHKASFKSKLPEPNIDVEGVNIKDYWRTLADNCIRNPYLRENLTDALRTLRDNGDDHILALDVVPNKYTGKDYYFSLYNNISDVKADKARNWKQNHTALRAISSISLYKDKYNNCCIYDEKKGNTYRINDFIEKDITEALLTVLRRINMPNTPEHKALFGNLDIKN